MKRDKLESLESWGKSYGRKPLLVRGARQVGKTWLVREFGKSFPSFIEINFERNPEYSEIFEKSLIPRTIITEISAAFGEEIIPGKTLLFFDEIQESPPAIKSLRYFYEELSELHVVAAGSLLGFTLREVATGVGRWSYLNLYPLSFGEFLSATNNNILRNRIIKHNLAELFLNIHHDKLLKIVRDYMLVGGMPAVVSAFIETGNLLRCQEIQDEIIQSYKDDFVKYAKASQIPYLNKLLLSIPLQIGNKFVFSKVDQNIRTAYFSNALELLEIAGLLYKVYHTKADGIPLQSGINTKRFKIIFFDIGLLQRMLNVDFKHWMTKVDIDAVNKGAIAEQFVGQELATLLNAGRWTHITYWHREKRGSSAEIDYLIEKKGKIIPIEVKANIQGGMKSLHLFLKEKKKNYAVKISKHPFSFDKVIQSIPFYAMEKLFQD